MDTWLEKYRPNKLDDYLDYTTSYKHIIEPWITAYNNNRLLKKNYYMYKPFIILLGEPGVGKTTLAQCIFNTHNYIINECNSSSTRTKSHLEHIIKTGKMVAGHDMRLHNVGVIMDEIDGLSVNESNGVNAVLDIVLLPSPINTTATIIANDASLYNPVFTNTPVHIYNTIYKPRYPMIMTANSIKERKFKRIIDMSIVINVKSPSTDALLTLATRININEAIGLENKQLESIILSLGRVADYRIVIQQLWQLHHTQQLHNNPSIDMNSSTIVNDDNDIDSKVSHMAAQLSIHDKSTTNISLDNQLSRQLLYIHSMDIQNSVSSIICHRPHHLTIYPYPYILYYIDSEASSASSASSAINDMDDRIRLTMCEKFYNEYHQQLKHLIKADPNLFHLSIWENYSSVIGQIYLAICRSRNKNINRKVIMAALWSCWIQITQCYKQCGILEYQIATTREWHMQPYNVYLGAYTGIRLLNELNTMGFDHTTTTSTSKCCWLTMNTIKISYHTLYNSMKQDSSHLCNNLVFRTVIIPGDHNIASKDLITNKPNNKSHATPKLECKTGIDPDAIYNVTLDIAKYDPELFYLLYNSNNVNIANDIKKYGSPACSVVKKLDKVYKKLKSI